VVCPRCATENKAGRKFCAACGAPLLAACPACGATADPGDRFCGECAAPLVPGAVAAPESSSGFSTDEPARVIFAGVAFHAAVVARDRPAMLALHGVVDGGPTGSYRTAVLTAIRAGLRVLDGRSDEAAVAFRDAVVLLQAQGLAFDAARVALDAVLALGSDHPAARWLAGEARPVLEGCKAQPLLAQLDAALSAAAVSSG
jgi:hypothetical protein